MWERGFVDESKLQCYKIKVLDDSGEIVPQFSLEYMVQNCPDFLDEMSQLEYVCQQLGSTAVITTKYHAEYAGEGIEYSWGYSKSIYRRSPLKIKKGKENFDKLVSNCISRDVMQKTLIRRFSKRARQYMLSYQSLEKHDENENESNIVGQCISQQKIEKMKLLLKSHRAAIDFDKNFVVQSVTEANFNWDKELLLPVDIDKQRSKKKSSKRKRNESKNESGNISS